MTELPSMRIIQRRLIKLQQEAIELANNPNTSQDEYDFAKTLINSLVDQVLDLAVVFPPKATAPVPAQIDEVFPPFTPPRDLQPLYEPFSDDDDVSTADLLPPPDEPMPPYPPGFSLLSPRPPPSEPITPKRAKRTPDVIPVVDLAPNREFAQRPKPGFAEKWHKETRESMFKILNGKF